MSNLYTTLGLLLWLIPIAANIYVDRTGRKPNYLMMFVLRGMVAILHGVYFDPYVWADYLPVFIFQITSFWILFELGLNLVRGKGILYYDQSEGDSGWLDRFFMWAGPVVHAIAKVIVLMICILSIIYIYQVL